MNSNEQYAMERIREVDDAARNCPAVIPPNIGEAMALSLAHLIVQSEDNFRLIRFGVAIMKNLYLAGYNHGAAAVRTQMGVGHE